MTFEVEQDVRALLAEKVVDYERLETLLLLMRDHGSLDALRVGSALGIGAEGAARALDALLAAGLVATATGIGSYRFAPRTPALRATCARLALLYDERRVEIIQLMTEIAMDRVRNHAARTFADAFLLGKRKKKDG